MTSNGNDEIALNNVNALAQSLQFMVHFQYSALSRERIPSDPLLNNHKQNQLDGYKISLFPFRKAIY
jgi:hypothetical protein